MINSFGQDIQPGDYVAIGQRSGNGTEQRVGRVIELTLKNGRDKAHVLWEEEVESRSEDGFTYQSVIEFTRLFLIDGESLSPRIKRHLDNKYAAVTAP